MSQKHDQQLQRVGIDTRTRGRPKKKRATTQKMNLEDELDFLDDVIAKRP